MFVLCNVDLCCFIGQLGIYWFNHVHGNVMIHVRIVSGFQSLPTCEAGSLLFFIYKMLKRETKAFTYSIHFCFTSCVSFC